MKPDRFIAITCFKKKYVIEFVLSTVVVKDDPSPNATKNLFKNCSFFAVERMFCENAAYIVNCTATAASQWNYDEWAFKRRKKVDLSLSLVATIMESPPRQSMDWMMTTRINCCFFVSKDYEMIKGTNHFGQENTKIKWVIKNAAVFYCFVLTHSCVRM